MKKPNSKYLVHLWWILPLAMIILFITMKESTPNILEDVEKIKTQGNSHIEKITSPHAEYNSNPPTSGPHIGSIASWGTHTEEIPDEIQVHNLEDGGVIMHYHPDKVSEDEISQLEEIVNSHRGENIILAPRTNMDYKIVLTAWTKLLSLEFVDNDKIEAFIKKNEGLDHHAR